MKVLFVTRGWPTHNDPMSGNYEAVQAKALAARGCEVSVISVKLVSIRKFFCRKKISHKNDEGIDVYTCTRIKFPSRLYHSHIINRHIQSRACKKMFKICVKEKGLPDVVHAHIIICASYVAFVKDDYHLPFVITEHWTAMNKPEIPEWLTQRSFIYHRADCVICVSQALSDSLKRNFNVNSIVINNMVSDQFFNSIKVERNDGCFRFVACGAFRKNGNKGFDLLVDAFAKANFPKHVSLDIVGDGEDRSFIESKIIGYSLTDQIHLLGVKSSKEVSEILCLSDCFVLSSRLETFAIVVIEAMAKGLPVIATKCGGPETFLRPEHGLLVEKGNIEKLAEAMVYMVEHHSEYDTDRIKEYCHNHFSEDVIAEKIIDVYNQIID